MPSSISRSHLLTVVAALSCMVACGSSEDQGDVTGDQTKAECSEPGRLEVVVTDAWGRILSHFAATSDDSYCAAVAGTDCELIAVGDSRDFELAAEGFLSQTLTLHVDFDIPGRPVAWELDARSSLSAVAYGPSESGCSHPTLFVGLHHQWFADSGRMPTRNQVEAFFCGQHLFERLYLDLLDATTAVRVVTWWWQSRFELHRPEGQHPLMTEGERWPNTAMALLQALPDVKKNVIVARFASEMLAGMAYVNTDTLLRDRAYDLNDNFEVLLQGNPVDVPLKGVFTPVEHEIPFASRVLARNPEYAEYDFPGTGQVDLALDSAEAASWHQKAWTIDGKIGYISGMNVKSTDWDTPAHGVFEARRMKFQSTLEERQAVVDRLAFPDVGPRKDSGMRVAGPAARDMDEIFMARWEWGRSRGDMFAEYTQPYELLPMPPEPADGIMTQVVVTMPEPFGERSVQEIHEKAIRNAQSLVFIEDQYFRVPVLLPAFADALSQNPDLCLVVVTKDVSPLDGAKKWTLHMDSELRKLAGDRYLLVQLKAFDGEGTADGVSGPLFVPMDVHTKLMFVDDLFFTAGSANKNNRGLLYEGEMNGAVLDQPFVSQTRKEYMENITGLDDFSWKSSSGCAILAKLSEVAAANASVEKEFLEAGESDKAPQGMVYPLEFTSEYHIECGPDAF